MGKVLELSERLWTGQVSTEEHNPVMSYVGLEALSDELAFVCAFGNVTAIHTDEGLVVIDTGGSLVGRIIVKALREWNEKLVHTVVYTHGHVDHVCGVSAFQEDAQARKNPNFTVIGHERVAARFERYRSTAGYNATINARQFGVNRSFWPREFRDPDVAMDKSYTLSVGGETIELNHDRGETDDHLWVWWEKKRVLCTGDLFIWASPNCGNPQKAQRYPREWALALRKMAALQPEVMLPGHGPPILGEDRIGKALNDTASLLETLFEQVLAMMNDGAALNDILHSVTYPEELLEQPYLRPVYDEPSFIVRNIWRLYGGWYDGNPARLKPPEDKILAEAVANAAGGQKALIVAAEKYLSDESLELACQFAEWAYLVEPNDLSTAIRRKVYGARVERETSLMAKGIFGHAAKE